MHCVTLAEIAALISQHGPDLIASRTAIRADSVTCYWASSRKRLDAWHGVLCEQRTAQRLGHAGTLRRWWEHNQPVLEDIVVSEMLTRVVAALTAEIESTNGRDEVSPVTHAIYLAHMELSNRVYRLIIQREGHSVENAVRLNRLQQGVQRWTDAMLGRLSLSPTETLAYAFDHDRAKSFAEESRADGVHQQRTITCWLSNASMRDMLCRRTSNETPFPDANQDIANSLMLLLQSEVFDDLGTIKSGWSHRIASGVLPTDCPPLDRNENKPLWSLHDDSNDSNEKPPSTKA